MLHFLVLALITAASILMLSGCAYTGVSYTPQELESLEESRARAVELARNDKRIARGVFLPGPEMWYPRAAHEMFLLADGNVLVTGGPNSPCLGPSDYAPPELFQSQLKQFLPAPGESAPIAKILNTGKVTVNDKPLAEGNALRTLGSLFAHAHWRTLRLDCGQPLFLPGHKILVPGGVSRLDNNRVPPNKALLYDLDKQTRQYIEGMELVPFIVENLVDPLQD